MNAGADKVEFNYIQYVLLDIKLAFFIIIFFSQLKFYFKPSRNTYVLAALYSSEAMGISENLIWKKNLAHFSL